jgi:hypothetical protein
MSFFHLHAKCIVHANGYDRGLEKKRKRKACLAIGEKLLVAFVVV